MTPYRIPLASELFPIRAPDLSRDDRREMYGRVLADCCDINCDEAVVRHLHAHGLSIRAIDNELAVMIDEARNARLGAERG